MRRSQWTGGLVVLSALSVSSHATTINALTAPTLLLRPNDGATYAFPILITVTPGIGEMVGGRFPIVFRDSVIGTAFDWASVNIPPNRVGEQLTFIPTFRVGCTNSPTPEIFGPLGTFNNDADTAEFLFPTQRVFTGAVKIECLLRDPNLPGPGPQPENRDIEDLPIPTPTPDDPVRNDLIQDHLLNVGSGLTPTAEVPEPRFAGLLALAGLFLAGRKWMNRTRPANRSH